MFVVIRSVVNSKTEFIFNKKKNRSPKTTAKLITTCISFSEQNFRLSTGQALFFLQTESLFTGYNISAGYTSLLNVNRGYWLYDRN